MRWQRRGATRCRSAGPAREAAAARHKFTVPAVDAPNVAGAARPRLPTAGGRRARGPVALQARGRGRKRGVLYVSIPRSGRLDRRRTSWIVAGRKAGKLSQLDRAGRVMTRLTRPPTSCCPGAAWVEKDASYTNDGHAAGHLASDLPPGEAREDWQILVERRRRAGRPARIHESAARCAARLPQLMPATGRSPASEHRLCASGAGAELAEASNPTERSSGTSCSRTCRRSSSTTPTTGTLRAEITADARSSEPARG